MIEYPPGSGRYVMITSPSQAKALALPVTQEELAQMELADAAENVLIAYGMGWDLEGVMARLKEALEDWHVSDIRPSDRSPDDL